MSHWIAVGVAWTLVLGILAAVIYLIASSIRKSVDPALLLFKWILTAVLVIGMGIFVFGMVGYNVGGAFIAPLCCAALGLVLSIIWTPNITSWLLSPLTSAFDGGTDDWDPGPLYSSAMGRRKRGQYAEAIAAVEKQLAIYSHDFPGQMLLAEIYAEDLHQLPAAAGVVAALCQQPGHTPKNIAYALNQLADWHMKLGADPESARQALQQIIDRFPESEHALAAAQRLAHSTQAEAMLQARHRAPVTLRPGMRSLGLTKQKLEIAPQEEAPEAQAQRLVEHLEQHPLDQEAREKLATLYAEHYGRLDLAVDQLDQLLSLPEQPPRAIARWLNLIADWHVRFAGDAEAARAALQQIVDSFPGLAVAEAATQRLSRLGLELKARQPGTRTVTLGVYEQNIGLKKKAGEPPPPG